MATGKERRRFLGHRVNALGVAFSPDGRALISTGANEVVLWEIATGGEWHRAGASTWFHPVAVVERRRGRAD